MDSLAPIRRQHQEVLAALDSLEAACGSGAAPADTALLLDALAGFIDFHDRTLAPHFLEEEHEVYPLLARYLPPEADAPAALREEHATARALVELLRRDLPRARAGSAEALSELRAAAPDLAVLLRDHIRKEEHAVYPLLERLRPNCEGDERG